MAMFNKKTTAAKETKAKPTADKKVEAPSMKDLYAGDAKKEKSAAKAKKGISSAYKILVKPLVTEKATNLSGQNKYVFIVSIGANKIEVSKAIEEVYGISPINVNIIKMKGKQVARGRVAGRRKDFKKAIVTLKKGETIQVYEGV